MTRSSFSGALKDIRSLGNALERQRRETDRISDEDVTIEGHRRLLLRSPNGTYWSVTIDDSGNLHTTNMGSRPYG